MQVVFTKKEAPKWLLDMWKEIDDKTFGKGFDCFAEDAVCNLGVADWKGREAIRANLKAFIDTGFTALHHVTEYWDGGSLNVFRGVVDMTPDGKPDATVHPTMMPTRIQDVTSHFHGGKWSEGSCRESPGPPGSSRRRSAACRPSALLKCFR